MLNFRSVIFVDFAACRCVGAVPAAVAYGVAGAFGAVVLVLVILVIIIYLRRRSNQQQQQLEQKPKQIKELRDDELPDPQYLPEFEPYPAYPAEAGPLPLLPPYV